MMRPLILVDDRLDASGCASGGLRGVALRVTQGCFGADYGGIM